MTRLYHSRELVVIVVVCLAMTALACGSPPKYADPGSTRGPNIVLFLADDHGQWAAGPYGNNEVETPALDTLATSGVLMANEGE